MSACAARLDRLPLSRFHLSLLLIGGLGFLFEAMDVAIIAFVLPAIREQWDLSNQAVGLLAGSASMGGIAGAFLGGWLGDRFGRKQVMLYALAVYTLATLGCAMSTSWTQFLFWRIIAGFGTSAEAIIIVPYLIEFVPPAVRGRFIGTLSAFLSLGFLCAAVLGYLLVPGSPEGWRRALFVGVLPILLLLWWRRTLPESPRWLESQGRDAEALAVIERIEARVARSKALPPVPPHAAAPDAAPGRARVGDLFRTALRPRMLSAIILFFAIGFSHYAFFSWMPSLLVGRGMSISSSFAYSLAIYGAQLPGYLTAAWVNDAFGARRTIIWYITASALASFALALAGSNQAILIGSIALSFSMNGVLAGVYAFVPTLFPTGLRATAQGIAGVATRCAATISPILIGLSYADIGFAGVFIGIGMVLMLGVVPIAMLRKAGSLL
ncbi:putative MFS transporter [Sphingopyxis panaciterrae]|uniref:MFS transporter n=1 Tax=Sphingopyxis panaciterrae TaxID=363841 RepID=UPI00141EAFDC|nr:MFS transporter [Sphingopyxis panaciterrae]NIJ36675.1 putative MFS transporter [Sphingopyxis panaciterrae]